jgi:S1-C subfamily serine protease
MKRHHPMPALRNALFSAAMALSAGVVAVPSFAQTDTQTAPQAVPPTVTQPAPAAPAPAEPHRTQAGPASVADLAEGLLEAVVNISTSQNVKGSEGQGTVPLPQAPEGSPFQDFFDEFFKDRQGGGGQQKVQSLGSGFVVDAAEGIVVTNNHVIADADEIEINFSDGSKLKAELVGTDTKTDIAVLKVDPTLKKLKAVKFGDSDKMRIGDWVMAIGNPFGLGGTVTVGIISARNRDIDAGPYDDFIQTDAAINRGNSGGPLFNMYGEVVGINTAIISPSGGSIGIGFSIPAEMATGVVAQLREFGETRRGWLGVRIQPVTDEIAESLGIKVAKGALVSGIIKGGPVRKRRRQGGRSGRRPQGRGNDRQGHARAARGGREARRSGRHAARGRRRPGRDSRDPWHDGRRTQRRGAQQVRHRPRRFRRDHHGGRGGFPRCRARHHRRRRDHRNRAGIRRDAEGRAGPGRRIEGTGPQECASDACVESRRTAVRDDPDGLRRWRSGAES